MGSLYAKDNKLYAKHYLEIHIPRLYFDENKFARSKGVSIETLGLAYIEAYPNGKVQPIKLLNLPATVEYIVYDFVNQDIKVLNKDMPVTTLKYIQDSCVMSQSIQRGRDVVEMFLNAILGGRLPSNLDYPKLIDIWWKNIEISGSSLGVPSKVFEMIIANIYRDKNDIKKRFAEYFGSSSTTDGHEYQTGNVRDIVESLSTFSGLIFEDISRMVTSGINNSKDGVEEKESPLEKTIHY